MSKYRYTEKIDNRDYAAEARNLIKPLGKIQLYELYEIVLNKIQRTGRGTQRERELLAVKEAIEGVKGLDYYRMKKLREGFQSDMARGAVARDGNTKPNRKKV